MSEKPEVETVRGVTDAEVDGMVTALRSMPEAVVSVERGRVEVRRKGVLKFKATRLEDGTWTVRTLAGMLTKEN